MNERNQECCNNCSFKSLCLSTIDNDAFEDLEKSVRCLTFRKGETIIKQGSLAGGLMYLAKGVVKYNYEAPAQRNVIFLVSRSPDFIGCSTLYGPRVYMFSVVAVEDCHICMINLEAFERVLSKNAQLLAQFYSLNTNETNKLLLHSLGHYQKHVNGRIADVILHLSNTIYNSDKFTLPLTRKEIAEWAGASPENIMTTLSRFHKEGILKVDGKDIVIIDKDRLLQISRIG